MNPTLVAALVGAAGAIIGALTTLFIQSRRLSSDIRLTEAQTEKTQHEAAGMIITNLSKEVERLKQSHTSMEERLTRAETRATGAEVRLVDSESRAAEFRRAVIAIGERLDLEREKSRDMVTRLVGIIDHLLSCIEDPSRSQTIDRPAITSLIQKILDDCRAEVVVRL